MKFKSDIEVQAGLKDSSGVNGTAGQVLSSNGGTVSWVNGSTVATDVQNRVKAGVAINKGQAVYVTGADGTNVIVGLASNTSEATSSKTLGLLNATVAINGFADVVQIGKLSGLNTSAATVGDPVWLGTNGNLIYGLANKPYAPAHLVYIGVVTRVNASNGEIFVSVQNGFELKEIHDVDIITTPPVNGDILGYNGTLWVNKTIPGWLGYTPADDALVVHKAGTETITGAKTFTSNLTANSFIKIGGTADQYLKADGSVSTAMNSRVEVNFIATSGQTTFTTPYEVGQVEVYYNGSKLYPDEFVATNGTTIVLVTPATLNAQISIVKFVSSFNTTSIRTETVFTTTGGQTTFSVNYAIGQVDVFYNGSKLSPAEFTANNGTSVVLGFACAAGESIVIDSFVNQVSGAVGTANKVAKFTGVASLGDSQIYDNGTYVGINNINPTEVLDVTGAINVSSAIRSSGEIMLRRSGNELRLGSGVGADYSVFYTGGTERMRIFSSGNVFIGSSQSDAGYKLDVNGTGRFSGGVNLATTSGNVGIGTTSPISMLHAKGSGYSTLTLEGGTNQGTGIRFFGDVQYAEIFGEYESATNGQMFFRTRKAGTISTAMTITSGGNVGIGTTSPTRLLSLGGTAYIDVVLKSTSASGVAGGGALYFGNSSTDSSGILNYDHGGNYMNFFTAGSERMRITSGGNVGIGTTSPSAVGGFTALTVNSNSSGSFIDLNNNDATNFRILSLPGGDVRLISISQIVLNTNGSERMRITSGGNVGIGTTSPGVSLEVNGLIRSIPVYNNTTATAANLVVSAGGTFERSTSSLKYKKEVRDYDKGLETLLKIRPVYYKGKSESDGDKQFAGLIAEEIHELGLTEFVQYAEDGTPDALAYTHMVALLIKGMQEQQAQIKELQDEIISLKNK